MENTFEPGLIYETFARYNLEIKRIDCFDRGNFAQLRVELPLNEKFITLLELQKTILNLSRLERQENIKIKIINIDCRHKSLRIDIELENEQQRSSSSPDMQTDA